jgi:hypothetical protein
LWVNEERTLSGQAQVADLTAQRSSPLPVVSFQWIVIVSLATVGVKMDKTFKTFLLDQTESEI